MDIRKISSRVGMTACAALLCAGGLNAATLWSNGAVNSTLTADNRCDTGPNQCGNSGGAYWTIFDNFNIPSLPAGSKWAITALDFTDFLVNGTNSDIGLTNWSIWAGDPLSAGKLVASGSGTTTASLLSGTCSSSTTCLESFTLNIPTVLLAGGVTYYLGTTNTLTPSNGGEAMLRAFAAGGNTAPGGGLNGLARWEWTNGSTTGVVNSSWAAGSTNNIYPGALPENATAFDLFGSVVVPEPSAAALSGIGLAGLLLGVAKKLAKTPR